MQNILKRKREIIQKTYFPFICLAFFMFFFHLFLNFNIGDDIFFANSLNKYGFRTYLYFRWNSWTSRLVIEALEIIITHTPFLWKLLDTGAIILLVYSISKLTGCYENRNANWIICFTFLLYPFSELSNAGWCSTTLNYLWPGAACVFVIYICSQAVCNKLLKRSTVFLSYLSALLAVNSEQCCGVLFILGLITNIYLIYHKKFNYVIFFHFILSVISLIIIMACPGNKNRYAQEVINWYPNYYMLNAVDKIYIGVQNTINYLFIKGSILFTVLCLLVFILNHEKGKLNLIDFVAGFPFVLSFIGIIIALKNGWFLKRIPMDAFLLTSNSGIISIKGYFIVFLGILSFLFLFIAFYNLYGNSIKTIIFAITFCAGLLSSFVLGFSPTVYASNLRVFFSLNVSIILLIGFLLKNSKNEFINIRKFENIIKAIIILVIYININL